jgi:hypothetical protein
MTKLFSRFNLLLLGGTLLAAPVLAEQPTLKPFNADYVASYMGMEGNATMSLAPAASGQWKYTLSIRSSLASLSQSTLFDEHGGQWRPLSGSDNASVLIKKTSKRANYDWERGVATWSGDVKPDRAGPVKLQAGDLDAMLVNLAIARDAPSGKPLHYRMVDEGVAGKTQQATKVSRIDGNKQTILWVVDGLPAPARILQRKDGSDEIDLKLKAVR